MTDTKRILKCPACKKEMVKIYVQSADVNVDICLNGCGGIYFDNMEFYVFDENREKINEITQMLEEKTFQKVDSSKSRYCPSCGKKMVKNFTNLSKDVEIDDCYNCGGKFLDFGELETIINQDLNPLQKSKKNMKNFLNSLDYVDVANAPKYRRHKRSFLKKIFDWIFSF